MRPDFVIAPDGSDRNPGTASAPFATIQRAQRAVHALQKREPKRRTPICVQFRGGTYFLECEAVFTAANSGTEQAPVVYRPFGKEKPVLCGGRQLDGFTIDNDGHWVTTLRAAKRHGWSFMQLHVNHQRRYRPRTPKLGYHGIAAEMTSTATNGHGNRFRFWPGTIRKDWHNLRDVEVMAVHKWCMSRLHIANVDEKRQSVEFTGSTWTDHSCANLGLRSRFIVENVREMLGDPGEWYLDRESGELTYVPRKGETPENSIVIAPHLEHIIRFAGTERRPVQYIQIEGLDLAYNNYVLPREGHSAPQCEVDLSGAIAAAHARHIRIEDCTVRHTATYGIEFGDDCEACEAKGNVLYDLGAGGVKVGHTVLHGKPGDKSFPKAYAKFSHHIRIVNNCIAHGGRLHPAAVGIFVGHAHHNTVSHNTVHDFYYSGISVGWIWGFAWSPATDNLIEANRVSLLGQGVLADMAGIYTLGRSPGTVIRGNAIEDVEPHLTDGWGIYCDEGSSQILVENNLIAGAFDGGFVLHIGREVRVINNIFAFSQLKQLEICNQPPKTGTVEFRNNIVYYRSGILHGRGFDENTFISDNNIYWKTGGQAVRFNTGEKCTLREWQELGHDWNSVVADPQFADPEKGDFRLAAHSPAIKAGYKPVNFRQAGCRRSLRRHNLPPVPAAFPTQPGPRDR